MYADYWGLTHRPFDSGEDPRWFFASRSHRACLLKVRYGIQQNLGGVLLTGGAGYGKTYLVDVFAAELPEQFAPVVRLPFPQLSPAELLSWMLAELDPGADRHDSLGHTVHAIARRLERLTSAGQRPVLVVDDAHFIEDAALWQTLHLLLNLHRPGRADFALLLVGDRELIGRLSRFADLNERLAIKALIQPLNPVETCDYVRHRMETAGSSRPAYSDEALRAIFELSGGVPRRINRLCEMSLLVGFAERLEQIDAAEIEAVSEELTVPIPD